MSCVASTVKLFDKSTGEMLQEYSGHINKDYRYRYYTIHLPVVKHFQKVFINYIQGCGSAFIFGGSGSSCSADPDPGGNMNADPDPHP